MAQPEHMKAQGYLEVRPSIRKKLNLGNFRNDTHVTH